jgi:opacity protein-like surface antigen
MIEMKRLAACLAGIVLATLAPAAAAAQPVSQAETMLFETDHLERVQAPAALLYAFRKTSNVEPGFSDDVRLDLAESKGKKKVSLQFLSGERKRDIPAVDDAHGNPVLLGFLERDIAEMKRLTGGSANYFRKRIRMALAEAAQVTREPITYGGKKLDGQAVRIQPYLNDPMQARFEKYVGKTYTFVVSDQVPGGVYQLRTSVGNAPAAAAAAGSPPVIEESLTLVKVAQPER